MTLNFFSRFHKTQTVRPAVSPKQFFPTNSVVIDFPFGQLQPAIALLQEEELIFLMYYAPWCAESLSIRDEFAKAAKVFQAIVSMSLFILLQDFHPLALTKINEKEIFK